MTSPAAPTPTTGLAPNVAGALSYILGPITGVLFLVLEKENRFVRFHAAQSITTGLVLVALSIALSLLSTVLAFVPVLGWIVALLLAVVMVIAALAAAAWFLGNPLDLLSAGPPPAVPRPPARVQPAPLAALAPVDMPVASPIPAAVFGSFAILVGTFDNARDEQRITALLRAQQLTPYSIDILMAPGDLQRRVLLGRYATLAEAEAARQKLGPAFVTARVIPSAQERVRILIP